MFLSHSDAAILFNAANSFEQINNILPTEGPMWNLVKTGQAVSEEDTFKDCYEPGVKRKKWKWNQQQAWKLFIIFINNKNIRQCAKQKNISKQYLSNFIVTKSPRKIPQEFLKQILWITVSDSTIWSPWIQSLIPEWITY